MTPSRWFLVLGLCALFGGMWWVLVKGLDSPPPPAPVAPLPPGAVAPVAPPPPPPTIPFAPTLSQAQREKDLAKGLALLPPGIAPGFRAVFENSLDAGRPHVPWGFSPDGGLRYQTSAPGIQAAVRGGIPDIKHCYEEWLKVQPDLQGRLTLHFTIDTNDAGEGTVTRISLGDAGMGHLAMEGCVLQVFEDLKFEPPDHGTLDVSYPVTLSPEPDAG